MTRRGRTELRRAEQIRAAILATIQAILLVLSCGGATWAAIPEAARQDPRFALGYLVVTYYPGVYPDGAGDSTAGIQEAIDDAFRGQLVLLLPPGEYVVSDTLRAFKWRVWSPARNGLEPFDPDPAHKIVGSSLGPKRPVIRLSPDAKGFDDPERPRPVLAFRYFQATGPGGTRPVDVPDPLDGAPEHFTDYESAAFGYQLRNIDFDLGGHPGAVGVVMGAAQYASLSDVRIDATGAYAGFFDIPGRNSGAVNIEVYGGRYGIMRNGGAGSVVVGARLIGQTVSALRWTDFVPLTMVGFEIVTDTGPAITTYGADWSSSVGAMSLIDGTVEVGGGGPAIDNSAGKNLYVRNVYVKGTDRLIKSGSQPEISAKSSSEWTRIAEYAYTDQLVPARRLTADGRMEYLRNDQQFRSFSVIDGAVGRVPEPVVSIDDKTPPEDLLSRHLPTVPLPVYEGQDDGTVVVTDFGARPFGSVDSWEAIQKAIDTSPTGRVFIPRGTYAISRPLVLRPDTVLLGIAAGRTIITSYGSWSGIDEGYLIETVDDPLATTFVGFLDLHYDPMAVSGVMHWQAGPGSGTFNVGFARKGNVTNELRRLFYFSGNAGGRHYHLAFHQDIAEGSSDPNSRGVFIEGTTHPLNFYGLNTEASKGGWIDANVEIVNAQAVRIYNWKREGRAPSVIIRDSKDIGVFSLGRQNNPMRPGSGGYVQIYGDSDNIVMANLVLDRYSGEASDPTLREALRGLEPVEVAFPDNVSLYKRGNLSASAPSVDLASLPKIDIAIPDRVVPGVRSPRIDMGVPDGVTVRRVAVYVNDGLVYQGDAAFDSIEVDTRGLRPGRQRLLVEMVTERGGEESTTSWRRNFDVAPFLEIDAPAGALTGKMAVGIRLSLPAGAELRGVSVSVDGDERARSQEPLDTFLFDTTQLEDGAHQLEVVAEMARDGETETYRASREFRTDNYREIIDELEPPIDGLWFGTVNRLKTVSQSAGWAHVTGDAPAYWGDASRMAPTGSGPEHLVWQLPESTRLHTYRIIVYASDEQAAGRVRLAVSADGKAWEELPLTPRTLAAATGRVQLELGGEASSLVSGKRFVRVQVQGADAPGELQLGQIYLKGILEEP